MAENAIKIETKSDEIFLNFLEQNNSFAESFSDNLIDYFEQEKKPELELIQNYLEAFRTTMRSAGLELQKQFEVAGDETKVLINNHLRNTGIIGLLSSTNSMMKVKGKVIEFLEKIAPILEIIKKIFHHIIELFPKFLEKILKKIIIPLLEAIENFIKFILSLFSSKSAARYLIAAERDFLTSHILWRKMQFESLDTSDEKV